MFEEPADLALDQVRAQPHQPASWLMPPLSSFLVLNSVLPGDAVDLVLEGGQLGGDGPTIGVGQGVVRALDRQLTHALQDEWVSFRPPSAVWIIEMPSCALRIAWFKP